MNKAANKIFTCTYIISKPSLKGLPPPKLPEFAFIGRSNVGKSSLINMITGLKKLARISKTPGKTRYINHFLVNENIYLVDLPGYGYAKISKETRNDWKKMIKEYLTRRTNLQLIFVLIDIRIPPQRSDLEFINWLGDIQVPFHIAYTKADKQGLTKTQSNRAAFRKAMAANWDPLPQEIITSAKTGMGREELLSEIFEIAERFEVPR